jgi:gliding motility-associated-like protein
MNCANEHSYNHKAKTCFRPKKARLAPLGHIARVFISLMFFYAPHFLLAQSSNVWTFGINTGLDFNKDPVQVFHPVINTDGTCASICDETGKLILYTDGNKIYNSYFETIQNGVVDLNHHAVQDGIILKDNTNKDIFYVFISQLVLKAAGVVQSIDLYCYTVDLSDPGKKGKVVKTEKIQEGFFMGMLGIRHKDKKSVWVVTEPNRDSLYSYLLDSNGLHPPVKNYRRPIKHDSTLGYLMLKASHDGKKIVETWACDGLWNMFPSLTYINMYDFDNATGLISNKLIIDSQLVYPSKQYAHHAFASSEFSPNDSLFYVTDFGLNDSSGIRGMIYPLRQYARYAPDIKNSVKNLPLTGNSGIQLGPDGRIYVSYLNAPYLSVIHYPNKPGLACHLVPKEIDLQSKGWWWYSFPNLFFEYIRATFTYNPSCIKGGGFVNQSDTNIFKKFTWYFTDMDTAVGNNPGHIFPKTGNYFVRLKAESPTGFKVWYSDSIHYIKMRPIARFVNNSDEGCQWVNFNFIDSSWTDALLKPLNQFWYWDFGDQTPPLAYTKTKRPVVTHVYTQSGTYTVKLVYGNGICTDTFVSTQKVKIVPAPRPGFIVSARFDNFSKVVKSNSGDTVAGCAPLVINVNDKSEGTVVKYVYTVSALPINRDKPPAGDSTDVPSFSYSFLSPGLFVIHQYLTGTTGCITEDSAFVRVRQGVSATDKPVILRASFNGQNNVLLHWLPVPGAKHYSVFRYNGLNTSVTNAPKGDFLADIADTMFADNHVGISINPANVPNAGSVLSPAGAGRFWNNVHYQITASDSCGNRTGFSNIARPILLTGQNVNNQYFLINWSPYENWDNGVYRYDIELQDNEGFFHNISNLTDTAYHDGDHFSLAQLGQCYRIKATEQDGNQQISYSNTLCIPYLPQIWVPNVFTPDNNTVNDSFKISTIGIKNYKLTVYNTWGEVVFSTSSEPGFPKSPSGDIGAGWDGRFHGQPVPEGVYFYTISAFGNAEYFFQKGTVQVMR